MTRARQEPRAAILLAESEGAECVPPPSPQPDATMLSRLLKEHQAKQNERKELQGEPRSSCLPFSLLPRPSLSPEPGPRVTAQIQGKGRASGHRRRGVGVFLVPTGSGLLSNTRVPLGTSTKLGLPDLLVPPPAHGTLCRLAQAASPCGSGKGRS